MLLPVPCSRLTWQNSGSLAVPLHTLAHSAGSSELPFAQGFPFFESATRFLAASQSFVKPGDAFAGALVLNNLEQTVKGVAQRGIGCS